MTYSKRLLWAAAILAAIGLAGCEETDRPLSYEKGVYGGKEDQTLSPEDVDALRERLREQRA